METTTLTIHLPKDVGLALERKAKTSGKEIETYVEEMVADQVAKPSFRQLFADVREAISISDGDLESEIVSALKKVRQSKKLSE